MFVRCTRLCSLCIAGTTRCHAHCLLLQIRLLGHWERRSNLDPGSRTNGLVVQNTRRRGHAADPAAYCSKLKHPSSSVDLSCLVWHFSYILREVTNSTSCRFKEITLKAGLNIGTALAGLSGMLGADLALKETETGARGTELPLVTLDPAACAAVGKWGDSSPRTVQVVRHPLNTRLCGESDADLCKCIYNCCRCCDWWAVASTECICVKHAREHARCP